MKYQTTKKQCQKIIDKINGVCSGCGGKITPLKTVDNADNPTYWAGCLKCSKFCSGVDKDIFKLARRLVLEGEVCYSHSFRGDYSKTKFERDYWFCIQVSGFVSELQTIGYLKNNKPRFTRKEFDKNTVEFYRKK